MNRIKNAYPESLGRIEFMKIDLADLETIKPAVEVFLTQESRLDVLVNNAAVRHSPSNSTLRSMGTDSEALRRSCSPQEEVLTLTAMNSK